IRDLHITFPITYSNLYGLLEQDVDFSLLEDISLELSTMGASLFMPPLTNLHPTYSLLKKAYCLRKLQLKFPAINIMNPTLVGDWSHLTHVEFGYIYYEVFLNIFSKMTALESCKVFLTELNPGNHTVIMPAKIHLPFLHTLEILSTPGDFILPIDRCNLPNLQTLLITSDGWFSIVPPLLKTTTSLRELGIKPYHPPRRDTVKAVLGLPALSDLTHFSIEINSRYTKSDIIDQHTLKAIASGQLVPHLHTFHFEGRVPYKMLIHLLVNKGFVSTGDGSTIFPDVPDPVAKAPRKKKAAAMPQVHVADPFQQVKICRCKAELRSDPSLMRIVDLVGEDCFIMEVSEVDQWNLMHMGPMDVSGPGIGWEMSE
ncbi:hypothetical protein BDN72DRAFT_386136, partial [Pluteus cervinus]